MKILRASVKGQPDKVYDEEKLAKLDEEQGRKRLSSGEVEALISLSTGRQLMVDGYAKLKEHAKYAGATRRLNMAIPMAYNAIQQMTSKVSGAQMITVINNTNNVCISLSADPIDGQCNISYNNMSRIAAAALETCTLSCIYNREESKRCPLRRAYECVPGLKIAAKGNSKDASRCPYVGLEIEVE